MEEDKILENEMIMDDETSSSIEDVEEDLYHDPKAGEIVQFVKISMAKLRQLGN